MKIFYLPEFNTIIKEGGEKIQLTTKAKYILETILTFFVF